MPTHSLELASDLSKIAEVVPRIAGAPDALWLGFASLASLPVGASPPGTLFFVDATLSGFPSARVRCGKKTPPVAMTAQRHGGLLLHREFGERWLDGVPPEQATLRPVEVHDDMGLVSDAYALVEVHACYPLDRDGTGVVLFDPALPHGAHVADFAAPSWGEGRTPPSRIFRLLELPSSIFVDEALLAALEKATKGGVAALAGRKRAGEPAFPPRWAKSMLPPFEPAAAAGARAADAFWALARGEKQEGLRAAALANPLYAVALALSVDRAPADDTRTAASRAPDCAVLYAVLVDRGPHPITEQAASTHGVPAGAYAQRVTARIDDACAALLQASGGHDAKSVERARALLAPIRPWLEQAWMRRAMPR